MENNNIISKYINIKTKRFYVIFFILLWTFIFYYNSIFNLFTNWDDPKYILDNLQIREFTLKSIRNIFTSFNGYYQPLTFTSYALEYKFFGFNPFYFHITNLILHLANIFLVFIFIRKLSNSILIAAFVSLLFGIHPMHVESVAWITERKDVLYTFFYLLSLITYTIYIKNKNKNKKINLYIGLTLLFYLLSIFAKPAAITLPFLLILIDYYELRILNWKLILEKIPFFLISVFFGYILIINLQQEKAIADFTNIYTLFQQFFIINYAVLFYFIKLFFPFHQSVLHYYPNLTNGFLPFIFYLSPVINLIIIFVPLYIKKLRKDYIFGMLFFLISISIVLQIVPTSVAFAAERYTYIPYLGLFYILIKGFLLVIENNKLPKKIAKSVILIALLYFVVFFSIKTQQRIKVWKNGLTLFTDVVKKYPEGHLGYLVLGNAYSLDGNYTKALDCFNKAVSLHKTHFMSYFSRGEIKTKLKDYEGALKDFKTSIRLNPDYSNSYNNLGVVQQYLLDNKNALINLKKAITLDNNNYEAYNNLGNLYAQLNMMDSALICFNKAIKLNPYYFEALFAKGNVYISKSDYKNALINYNLALSISPNNINVIINRASAKYHLNDISGACIDWLFAAKSGNTFAKKMLNKYCKSKLGNQRPSLQSKKDVLNEIYNNGQPKYGIIENIVNSDTVKEFVHYNEKGVIIEKGIIKNGIYSGKVNWYYDNGICKVSGFIKDTIPYGKWLEYYETGKIKATYNYENGLKNGIYTYFHSNGNIWTEREYNNGLLWNVISNFDKNGNKKYSGSIKNGTGSLYIYDELGNINKIVQYENGLCIN